MGFIRAQLAEPYHRQLQARPLSTPLRQLLSPIFCALRCGYLGLLACTLVTLAQCFAWLGVVAIHLLCAGPEHLISTVSIARTNPSFSRSCLPSSSGHSTNPDFPPLLPTSWRPAYPSIPIPCSHQVVVFRPQQHQRYNDTDSTWHPATIDLLFSSLPDAVALGPRQHQQRYKSNDNSTWPPGHAFQHLHLPPGSRPRHSPPPAPTLSLASTRHCFHRAPSLRQPASLPPRPTLSTARTSPRPSTSYMCPAWRSFAAAAAAFGTLYGCELLALVVILSLALLLSTIHIAITCLVSTLTTLLCCASVRCAPRRLYKLKLPNLKPFTSCAWLCSSCCVSVHHMPGSTLSPLLACSYRFDCRAWEPAHDNFSKQPP